MYRNVGWSGGWFPGFGGFFTIGIFVAITVFIIALLRRGATKGSPEAFCPGCAGPIDRAYFRCPHCGETIRHNCPACSRVMEQGWAFCPYCSEPLSRKSDTETSLT